MGSCFLVFHLRGHVAGLVMWGVPTAAELEPLFVIFRAFESPLGARLPRYFDVRRLEVADASVLAKIFTYVDQYALQLANMFTTIAVVNRGGLGLAIAEGVRHLANLRFEWKVFGEPAGALGDLGVAGAPTFASDLEALIAAAMGSAPLLRDLRAYCTSDLCGADLHGAALSLRTSVRTLQRRLRVEHGTSFKIELTQVRVERAKQLLTSTNRSIHDIAREVGCESARYFATIFRKATGRRPIEWRTETRNDKVG
ncbi:MAG: helix-turn-helix transcriptional regulator [Kofleriaceae bacterium]